MLLDETQHVPIPALATSALSGIELRCCLQKPQTLTPHMLTSSSLHCIYGNCIYTVMAG